VPVPLDEFTYSMVWHASYDQDPAHRWLRGVLVRLGRETAMDHAEAAV
jgi:DNA-binding transcriptional LysR family regulator